MRYIVEWRGRTNQQDWMIVDTHSDTVLVADLSRNAATMIVAILNEN